MNTSNKIYLGKSIDGFIAGKDHDLKWLEMVPNPEGSDLGFSKFIESIDALLMGRKTFEVLSKFDIPWPYDKPVFVLSNSMKSIPGKFEGKASLISGDLNDVLKELHEKGHYQLYIDGGKLAQSFLKLDLVDEMVLSTLPIVLGDGIPLFQEMDLRMDFELVQSEVHLGQIVKSCYKRKV